jgi:hypothetical protein
MAISCSASNQNQGAETTTKACYQPIAAVPFSSIRTMTVGSGITPDLLTLSGLPERRSRA